MDRPFEEGDKLSRVVRSHSRAFCSRNPDSGHSIWPQNSLRLYPGRIYPNIRPSPLSTIPWYPNQP